MKSSLNFSGNYLARELIKREVIMYSTNNVAWSDETVEAGAGFVEDLSAQSCIKVRDITCTYSGGRFRALNNVSLDINRGEVFGLIGMNGAGKTTLFHCLLGFIKANSGTILIDGKAPDDIGLHKEVGYMPERLTFNKNLSPLDFLELHHGLAQQPKSSRKSDIRDLLRRVELSPDVWSSPMRRFSRGMLQRVGIANALIGNPRFLFLDEPASGIDPLGVNMFIRLMHELSEGGTTIVLNSHQLEQVEKACTRVAFIAHGTITKMIDIQSLDAKPQITLSIRYLGDSLQAESQISLSAILTDIGGELLNVEGNTIEALLGDIEAVPLLVEFLLNQGVKIIEVKKSGNHLISAFEEAPSWFSRL